MRSAFLTWLLLTGCVDGPVTSTGDATDDSEDTDSDSDSDSDSEVDSPWEPMADAPDLGAWPAVGVIGTEIHVVPSNSIQHHVYDTVGDTWRREANLPRTAHYHAGAVVDGAFYVVGGGAPAAIDSVDWTFVYLPETDRWSPGPPLPTARGYVTSEVVDGEIAVIGGPNVSGQTLNRTVEILDAAEGSWRSGALLPADTMWPLYSAIAQVEGRIYLIGGGIANNPFVTTTAYDVAEDTHVSLAPLPEATHGPAGAALDGSIYVMGGYLRDGITDKVWRYDVAGDSFEALDPLPFDLAYSKAVAVDGCLYVVGGHDNANPDAARTLLRWCPDR